MQWDAIQGSVTLPGDLVSCGGTQCAHSTVTMTMAMTWEGGGGGLDSSGYDADSNPTRQWPKAPPGEGCVIKAEGVCRLVLPGAHLLRVVLYAF